MTREHHILNEDALVPAVKEGKVHVEFVEPQALEGSSAPFGGRSNININGDTRKGI